MTDTIPLIEFDTALFNLQAGDKSHVLREFATLAAAATGTNRAALLNALIHSEMQDSSGIGHGIAIPQLKSAPLQQPFIAIARLAQPVEFGAADGLHADIVCAVMSPASDGPLHLRRLSRVTRMLMESDFAARLRQASSPREFMRVLPLRDLPDACRAAA